MSFLLQSIAIVFCVMLATLMHCNSGLNNMCSLWPVPLFIYEYIHFLPYYKTVFILQFIYFKETVSRDFRPLNFFQKSIAPRPLSNTLKYFRILFRDIRDYVLCYISQSHDSPLCCIALSRLRAMQHSAEFLLKIFSI
jgi:hypothetical protein